MNNTRTAVIFQSGYIPWLGFFDLIHKADIFVFLDDVQWTRQDWRNRNRIRLQGGDWKWLTIPIKLEKHFWEYQIYEVEINYATDWTSSHLHTLMATYGKSPFFNEVFDMVSSAFERHYDRVSPLNYDLITRICRYLNLSTTFICSQNLGLSPELHKNDKLLAILHRIGNIECYLASRKSEEYMDEQRFLDNGIKVKWHDYQHPYYFQRGHRTFLSHLSILDLLFNYGKESKRILTGETIIERPERMEMTTPWGERL